MGKTKIKVVSIGHLPILLDIRKIERWTSSVFELVGGIDNYPLRCDSDKENWEFSDALLKKQLPKGFDADFTIAIVNVPIESNWYSRRLGNNQIVFTFHEIKEILEANNIPLENAVYRLLYAFMLLYKRSGNRIRDIGEAPFTHDETRGCIFDMNPNKIDLIQSCDHPIICDECQTASRNEKVSNDLIAATKAELKKIRKGLYYKMLGFVKHHPLWTLLASSIFAVVLGIIGSLAASFVYDGIKSNQEQGKTSQYSRPATQGR